jgi:hypothetical protein
MAHEHCPYCGKPIALEILRVFNEDDISDEEAEKRILALMEKAPYNGFNFWSSDIIEECHLPIDQCFRVLKKLNKDGKIKQG